MPKSAHVYDVAILGSGLAGTVLGACLARNGADVLILDAGTHPRFAIGESTIPYTSLMMRLVSERYKVPEIKWLANYEMTYANISTNVGIKRNFGYVYHRPGMRQNPAEVNQFITPRVNYTDNHFFRQDVDAFMLSVAVKYGASIKQRTKVVDVDIDDEGVTVIPESGDPYRAKFVVDASGFRSPLAQKFDLRQQPTRLRHHSRSVFTHMLNVLPFEDTMPKGIHGNPSPWSQGTLHHIFTGGWLWVIPFDNNPRATNPLCSVGLNLDPRVHPVPDCSPEEEFRRFLASFPSIAPQFAKARAVRDWVRTGRLQYSSKQTVGYRWCLTSHAAGFVDPLYSRGLSNSMEIINALGWRLLDAIRDDDFDVERFAYVQRLEQNLLDYNDDLVASSYTAFGNWHLWDAWFRMWGLQQILSTFEASRAYASFRATRDPATLERLERQAPDGALPNYGPLRALMREVIDTTRAVQEDGADPKAAGDKLMHLIQTSDFIPPMFGWEDPENRWSDGTPRRIARALRWARTEAPPEIGQLLIEGVRTFLRQRVSGGEFAVMEEVKQSLSGRPVIGKPFRVPAPR
ncbi:NAD(P)/FAD-dependent oxidoreductase [Streptomyces johnsoniae]|uniref:Tryptophan 7-halogenase n=1 Tax=Streptomyces johnsoniae TaxID=3075532 RepID=A0ABU2RZW4_9ACTN|nr:tryptophan 7-halogenase [Streptomyces sp. DSM 41886]MDT0441059.1 tryptophan 7-halogenase [Streptomyces sp. DSM 41886]